MKKINRIAVFCGSSFGNNPIYKKLAKALGEELGKRGIGLVYGGGNRGLMGELAHSASHFGAEVIGVLPKSMNIPTVTDNAIHTRLIITSDMHERKKTMYELADGFIAMPGGIGTLEELAEIYTWRQLGIHSKHIALLNINGFWNNLIAQLKCFESEGFLSNAVLDTLIIGENPSVLLNRMEEDTKELPPKL